jgi:PAS domain S-box-containing protein
LQVLLLGSATAEAQRIQGLLSAIDSALECSLAKTAAALSDRVWDVVVCNVRGSAFPDTWRALASHAPLTLLVADRFEDVAAEAARSGAHVCLRDPEFAHFSAAAAPLLQAARARIAQRAVQAFELGQRALLERIASGAPLKDVLSEIVQLVERQAEGMLCSLLLLDREQGRVRHGAAPSLPPEFVRSIDGAAIGPAAGSCGTAAFRGERVIVEDIATSPLWVDYKQIALPLGLLACWSSPIFSTRREVLGTFAMYYRRPHGPSAREISWVDRATHLAAIAIERDLSEQQLRHSEARYRQIVDTAYEGVWLLDAAARTLFVNDRTCELLGYQRSEMLGRLAYDFIDPADHAKAEVALARRKQNISEQFELCLRRKDGSAFWVLVAASPLLDERDAMTGALSMLTDITQLKRAEAALQRSEEELRITFEQAAIGMALVDQHGQMLRSNYALQSMLGYSEDELRGRTLAEFTHAEDVDRDELLQQSLRARQRNSYQFEKRFITKRGSLVWARLTLSLVSQADGSQPQTSALQGIAMIEDVTDRKRMEEAVRSSERLRALVYNAVTDVLFYVAVEDGDYRFLSVNEAFLAATGLREDQVVGQRVGAVVPEPSLSQIMANYAIAIREKRTVRWQEVSEYPAGTRYGEVSITPLFDERLQCTSLVGMVHDMTEHRRAQEQISAQAALLDHAKDAILLRDTDGTIRFWSKGAERFYGWTSTEALGKKVTDLIYRDLQSFERAQRSVLETGAWTGELAQQTRAGAPVVVESSWTLLRDAQGKPTSVLAINSDITERKRLEQQVFRAQRMDSLGTLAGGIAHDFNNILAAIVANTSMAAADVPPNHPARESLGEIAKASQRATQLVHQILTFSRQQASQREAVRLQAVAGEALALLRATLPASIHIEQHFAANLPKIYADPVQVHQIIMNLGTNAAHAMSETGGTLSVKAVRIDATTKWSAGASELPAGTFVHLEVADTGSGIDAATIEHIFDPFFTTKQAGKGTGLGLAVVHGVVKNHEGSIGVRSEVGKGTTFSVYLPAVKTREASARPKLRTTPLPGHGECILYVDDEEAIVRANTRMLQRLGYEVVGKSNARAALEAVSADPKHFDMVITDFALPDVTGVELVRALRRIRADLPIVVTSGLIDSADADAVRQLGVRELLLKPSEFDELCAVIQRTLHDAVLHQSK